MLFIVATHSVLAEVKTNKFWNIDHLKVLANGHHYGIAIPPSNGMEFITMVREGNLVTIYKKADSESECLYKESVRYACNGEYEDIHQIAYYDNGIYIANTGFNSVVYYSFYTLSPERFFLNGFQQDVNHVNSVYPCGSNLLLVMLNNRGAKPSEVALIKRNPGTGFEVQKHFSLPDKECHNIFVDEKFLVYNASKDGDFVVINLNSGDEIRRIHFPGYAKGLSVTQAYFITGYSEIALREDRNDSQGYLSIINRKTLEVENCINLSHSQFNQHIGNVNEVRCLSEIDYGHSCLVLESINLEKINLTSNDFSHPIKIKKSDTITSPF